MLFAVFLAPEVVAPVCMASASLFGAFTLDADSHIAHAIHSFGQVLFMRIDADFAVLFGLYQRL